MRSPGFPKSTPPARHVPALGAFLVLSLLIGVVGSLVTTPAIPTWYAGLNKPWFNPPNGVFPVVWTVLYVLMAVSAWLVWRRRDDQGAPAQQAAWALVPFFVQLALNLGWSFAFFGAHSPFAGLVIIAILLATIAWTLLSFATVDRTAALLLVPYFVWVGFASILNAAIERLN